MFCTVLVRAVFTVMYGVALLYQDYDNTCSPNPCSECKNVYSQMLFWILFTPEFQQSVMIFASPLAQLVALWGMSGSRVLEQLPLQRLQLDAARTHIHLSEKNASDVVVDTKLVPTHTSAQSSRWGSRL